MVSADVLASAAASLLPLARSLISPSEAEDSVQQVVLDFLEKSPARSDERSVRAWMEKRLKRLAEDYRWDLDHAPETYSIEALGG